MLTPNGNDDDNNQLRGLAPRSGSSTAHRGSHNASSPPQQPTEAATTAPSTVPALERRTTATVSFPVRTSSHTLGDSHEPFEEAAEVNTTPLLLEKLGRLLRSTADASSVSRINRHQAALASRRMKLIATTLRQMPHPAPSPRLLTALQSLCLLVRQCAVDAAEADGNVDRDGAVLRRLLYGPDGDPLGPAQCWPVLLCQHFTCRMLFRAAYRRLWAAWRMYSPMELEHADEIAEAKDRLVNAEAMLQLMFGRAGDAGELAQHKADMLSYYQRHQMSPWRIFLSDLEPTTQRLEGAGHADRSRSRTAELRDTHEDDTEYDTEAPPCRFRVLPTVYMYNGVPVVVKTLLAHSRGEGDGASRTTEEEEEEEAEVAAAMEHAADFLQDVASRCTWCHPHVLGCLGAYTEKFVETAATANEKEVEQEDRAKDVADVLFEADDQSLNGDDGQHDGQPPTVVAMTARVETAASAHVTVVKPTSAPSGLPWSQCDAALSGTPVMALGYVTELQLAPDSVTPCHTLGDLLFPSAGSLFSSSSATAPRHAFTLPQALDICAQLADGLQYILDDCGDVPAAVRTAWLTLDPSNVYVTRTIVVGGNEEGAEEETTTTTRATGEVNTTAQGGESNFSVFSAPPSFAGPAEAATAELSNDSVVVAVVANEHGGARDDAGREPATAQPHHLPSGSRPVIHADPFHGLPPLHPKAHGGAPSSAPAASMRFVVRFAPPTDWTGGATGSRWRPHPRATAPASYAVAQMLLALLTGQVPYATYASDAEVQRRVFDIASQPDGALSDAAGVRVKLSSSGQGYTLPHWLPPALAQWCRRALSLDRSQPPMELESLRDELTEIQARLPEGVEDTRMAPRYISNSTSFAAASREMSPRFDPGEV